MLQPMNRCFPFNKQQYKNTETRKAIGHYSYGLCDEIGRGFSSKVYKGRDENTSQAVAVKVIDMKMVKQSIHSVLLKNEINALKSLNSKNIMKLHDVFQTQNNTYIITEFCDNGDLSNLIKKKGRIEETEAIRIISEVCCGLKEMNRKGFIHRDIKPANILMDNTVPKIADFGFAVQINSNDQISQSKHYNVGTPLYMSPQALKQQGHTEKGDVWAIGIMFFEFIFGRTPFTGQSEAGLLSNIMHTGLQIPAYPAISDSAKDFIRRCLQVDDKRRWKISEMVSHCIINDSPEERLPMRNITNSKDIRSQSQGIKDCAPRINRNDNVPKKAEYHKQHSANIFQDQQQKHSPTDVQGRKSPLNKNQDLVVRSKSQKHLNNQNISFENRVQQQQQQQQQQQHVQLFQQQQPVQATQPQPMQLQQPQHLQTQLVQVPMKYKNNNDILFSQINFCRFLYKFSQQFFPKQIKLSQGLKEKLLFIISKNIAIKINKLSYLSDKENISSNVFNLDEYESYKNTESFQKFNQAIYEYNEKYRKHFEKMYKLIGKSPLNDKKFETIYDKELNEFESFYFVAQQYLKIALGELKQEAVNLIFEKRQDSGNEMSAEVIVLFSHIKGQTLYFVLENLRSYSQLISGLFDQINDYRKFQKSSKVEQLVDKQIKTRNYKELEDLINLLQD